MNTYTFYCKRPGQDSGQTFTTHRLTLAEAIDECNQRTLWRRCDIELVGGPDPKVVEEVFIERKTQNQHYHRTVLAMHKAEGRAAAWKAAAKRLKVSARVQNAKRWIAELAREDLRRDIEAQELILEAVSKGAVELQHLNDELQQRCAANLERAREAEHGAKVLENCLQGAWNLNVDVSRIGKEYGESVNRLNEALAEMPATELKRSWRSWAPDRSLL